MIGAIIVDTVGSGVEFSNTDINQVGHADYVILPDNSISHRRH